MIDFEFKSRLETHTFGRYFDVYAALGVVPMIEANLMLLNPRMVPICKMMDLSGVAKLPAEKLLFYCGLSFKGRAMSRDKLNEVVAYAPYPMLINSADNKYLIGKGFVAIYIFRQKIKPLMVAVVNDVNTTDPEDISLLVDPVYKEQPATIRAVVQGTINGFTGDIIYTNQIDKHLMGRIRLPYFPNIRAKKEFTESFIDQCIAAL